MAQTVLTPVGLTAFLTPEVTCGTPVLPTAATDTLQLREGISFPSQQTSHTQLKEVSESASVTGLIRDLREAGTARIPTYLRPNGAAGSEPQEKRALEALFGAATIVPATSATYKPKAVKNPYTLWVKLGSNAVVFATGAYLNGLTLRQGENGPPEAEWSLGFLKLGWVGESTLNGVVNGDPTPVATCVVADSTQFSVGGFVQIGTDSNGSAGYKITAIDYVTHTLTVSPDIDTDQLSGAAVLPYLPAAVNVGEPLDTRPAVKVDGTPVYWRSWEITVDEPIGILKEVTPNPADADYPTAFGRTGTRTVSARVRGVMRSTDVAKLRADSTDKSLEIDWSQEAAGDRVTVTAAQGRYNVPTVSTEDVSLALELTFDAKASSATALDELAIAYK
jgi:hypothetical protein